MEVDLMRGLALQSMHRKIAVVAARFWADSFLILTGRYAPRPPAAAPGHGGGAGGDEDDDDDFIDDALTDNECRFHAGEQVRERERGREQHAGR